MATNWRSFDQVARDPAILDIKEKQRNNCDRRYIQAESFDLLHHTAGLKEETYSPVIVVKEKVEMLIGEKRGERMKEK
jgi:hypothetical protein